MGAALRRWEGGSGGVAALRLAEVAVVCRLFIAELVSGRLLCATNSIDQFCDVEIAYLSARTRGRLVDGYA